MSGAGGNAHKISRVECVALRGGLRQGALPRPFVALLLALVQELLHLLVRPVLGVREAPIDVYGLQLADLFLYFSPQKVALARPYVSAAQNAGAEVLHAARSLGHL